MIRAAGGRSSAVIRVKVDCVVLLMSANRCLKERAVPTGLTSFLKSNPALTSRAHAIPPLCGCNFGAIPYAQRSEFSHRRQGRAQTRSLPIEFSAASHVPFSSFSREHGRPFLPIRSQAFLCIFTFKQELLVFALES